VDIDRIRELQAWLRAVKHCNGCGQSVPVSKFDGYAADQCNGCVLRGERERQAREREAQEAAETAVRHEQERAELAANASTVCPDCMGSKPLYALRCKWCQGRSRAGVLLTARTAVTGQAVS
jgi:DnaJ-class molecular chaperone